VKLGIDILLTEQQRLINGRTLALICNASSVTGELVHAAAALQALPGVRLAALFAPEHGLYGTAADGETFGDAIDPATGLPVYSLYGDDGKRPSPHHLAGLDALVFDVQAVGVRFYTYITTLLYVMQAAAEQALPIIVCDRPNPIGGEIIEGPVLQTGFESFIGPAPIPIRHGLTIGELARFYAAAFDLDVDLTVVPCAGWRRDMSYDETGLPWVPPSPAMPRLETALLYPGACLLEGTNLSEGRGTTQPFELAGAPWLDGYALAAMMNDWQLPGVRFRPVQFTPTSSKWNGETCHGVQLHITDRQALRSVAVGLRLIAAARTQRPDEFAWNAPHFDRLMGTDKVREDWENGRSLPDIISDWTDSQQTYLSQRETILIYQPPATERLHTSHQQSGVTY
jgi:uncharacterized protein YbbC (DUF1343 family)